MNYSAQPSKPLILFVGTTAPTATAIAEAIFKSLLGDKLETAWLDVSASSVTEAARTHLAASGLSLSAPEKNFIDDAQMVLGILRKADFCVIVGPKDDDLAHGRRHAYWAVEEPRSLEAVELDALRRDLRGRALDLLTELLPAHYADAQ